MNRKMMFLPSSNSLLSLTGEPGVGAPDNILETVASFLREKLRELLQLLGTLAGSLQEKFDQIFPPETRSATLHHWLAVGLTVVLPVTLSFLCLYYCCKCCCCGRGRRGVKMMKAPGTGGALIPRPAFEAGPKAYFLNLRTNRDLLF